MCLLPTRLARRAAGSPLRRALLAAVLPLAALAGGCTDSSPLAVPSAPLTAPAFPPLARPGSVYVEEAPSGEGAVSRFVLYEDNGFALQYATRQSGVRELGGRYARAGAVIEFAFADLNAVDWRATGTLNGERLSVAYNARMQLEGFADRVYVRDPGAR